MIWSPPSHGPILAIDEDDLSRQQSQILSHPCGGTLALTALVVISAKAGDLSGAANVERNHLLGGLLGAAHIFTVLVDEMGAGGVAAVTGPCRTASALLSGANAADLEIGCSEVAFLLGGTYLVVR